MTPPLRCALCLRGLNEWYHGGQAPLCAWCSDRLGPVQDPYRWELQAGRVSDAARLAWEYWAKPRQPYDEDEPLTHFFHCWRSPRHYRCAIALIEKMSRDYDKLLMRCWEAESKAGNLKGVA